MFLNNGILKLQTTGEGTRVKSLRKSGKDFLFPQQTIDGKVRGGMHICSPVFGKKEGLPKHGGLRDLRWKIFNKLPTSIDYKRVFKNHYNLRYVISFRISGNCLQVFTTAKNQSDCAVPFIEAWHPYYSAPRGAKVRFIDRNINLNIPVGKVYGKMIKAGREIEIILPGVGRVKMSLLDKFENEYVYVWTDWLGKYICVEPLIANPNKFNTEEGFFLLPRDQITTNLVMCFKDSRGR